MATTSKTKGTFGTRLAEARHAVKLTQEALGEKIGVSKSQVSYYEKDINRPTWDVMIKIQKAVKRSITFLVTGDEDAGGKVIDPKQYELITKLDSLPPALREFVYGAIELAEETKDVIPTQFMSPPTKESWPQFHVYLQNLAEMLRKSKAKK